MDFNKLKASLKGLQTGTTMGWNDELAGATQALAGYMSPEQLELNKRLKEQGFTGDVGPTNPNELYTQGRNEERASMAESQQSFPKEFMLGQLAGTGLGAAMPGPTVLNAPGALTAGLRGAGWGALAGAGTSDQEGVGLVKDTAIGAGLGGLGGAAFSKMRGALGDKSLISNEVGAIGKDVSNKISAQAVQQEMENPTIVKALLQAKHDLAPTGYDNYKQQIINKIRETLSQKMGK